MGAQPSFLVRPVIQLVAQAATRWIEGERDRHRASSVSMASPLRRYLEPYFSADSLDRVRIRRVPVIDNPWFYVDLPFANKPLDLRTVAGITYDNVVLINEARVAHPEPISLIFHELVHVVQYAVLGVTGFSERYVGGWIASGYRYREIPLEQQAYALQAEFESGSLDPGPVESRIQAEIGSLGDGV